MHATLSFENDTKLDLQVQSKHKFLKYKKKKTQKNPHSSSEEAKKDKQQKRATTP